MLFLLYSGAFMHVCMLVSIKRLSVHASVLSLVCALRGLFVYACVSASPGCAHGCQLGCASALARSSQSDHEGDF